MHITQRAVVLFIKNDTDKNILSDISGKSFLYASKKYPDIWKIKAVCREEIFGDRHVKRPNCPILPHIEDCDIFQPDGVKTVFQALSWHIDRLLKPVFEQEYKYRAGFNKYESYYTP